MALAFDVVDEAQYWYRPRVPGNVDPDDPNPFAVLISSMSAQELRKLGRANGQITKGEDLNFAARLQSMERKIITDHVHGVRGFDVGGKAPANGAEFIDALAKIPAKAYELIVADVLEAIQDASVLRAGLLDRPRPSSGS